MEQDLPVGAITPDGAAPDGVAEAGTDDAAEFELPVAFDLKTAMEAARAAAMAEADDSSDDGDQDADAPAPAVAKAAPAAPAASTAPERLTADEWKARNDVEQSKVREVEAKAAGQEQAYNALRAEIEPFITVPEADQSEHDALKALVYSRDDTKWQALADKGFGGVDGLERAIARVAELEGAIGQAQKGQALVGKIGQFERTMAWTGVDQALRAMTKHDGITQAVLEEGGDLTALIDRAITAAVKAAVSTEAGEWKGKLKEQEALYERRLTRAGGSSAVPETATGKGGAEAAGGAFLSRVSSGGRLAPGMIDRALRGEFANVPI